MAVKTIEFRCPHCGKKLPNFPKNAVYYKRAQAYGEPYEICRKCKKTYRNTFVIEAADALTLEEKVSFWITNAKLLVYLILFSVISLGYGLLIIIPLYLIACILTREKRQEHKNQVLMNSRNRLNAPEYFMKYLHSYSGNLSLSKLQICTIYIGALEKMKQDKPVKVEELILQSFSEK